MEDIVLYLQESGMQYLATIGLDGKPKVRPFQFMFEEDGNIWFCTSNQKEVYKELQKQPYVELCASAKDMSWLRLEGKVVFSENLAIKKKVLEKSPLVKSIYNVAENPAFEIFYLEGITASISRIGHPPKIFSF